MRGVEIRLVRVNDEAKAIQSFYSSTNVLTASSQVLALQIKIVNVCHREKPLLSQPRHGSFNQFREQLRTNTEAIRPARVFVKIALPLKLQELLKLLMYRNRIIRVFDVYARHKTSRRDHFRHRFQRFHFEMVSIYIIIQSR